MLGTGRLASKQVVEGIGLTPGHSDCAILDCRAIRPVAPHMFCLACVGATADEM